MDDTSKKALVVGGAALALWWLSRYLDEEKYSADPKALAQALLLDLQEGPLRYSRDRVRAFQRAVGLPETGLYDEATRAALVLQAVPGVDDSTLPPPFVRVVDANQEHESAAMTAAMLPLIVDPFGVPGPPPPHPMPFAFPPAGPRSYQPEPRVFAREELARLSDGDLAMLLGSGMISREEFEQAYADRAATRAPVPASPTPTPSDLPSSGYPGIYLLPPTPPPATPTFVLETTPLPPSPVPTMTPRPRPAPAPLDHALDQQRPGAVLQSTEAIDPGEAFVSNLLGTKPQLAEQPPASQSVASTPWFIDPSSIPRR